jgi:hypothetical protein
MDREAQISAYVSDSTKVRLDEFVRETGLKKGRVIEDALNAHLDALEELPDDVIIPTRIVLTKESGARFLERLAEEPKPTEALIKLMRARR